jgi:hypothetical protein
LKKEFVLSHIGQWNVLGTLITDLSVIQVTSSLTSQRSVILPSQAKGGDEIAFEGPEEATPVVSQPFKRRRNVKTNPALFEAVFEEYVASSRTSEEDVSSR